MRKKIISILGRDRPGILAAVAQVLLRQGCNIEDVSQTILQSVFGALLIVSTPANIDTKTLRDRLREGVADLDLHVFVGDFAGTAATPEPAAHPFVITAFGPDRHGLVEAIATALAGLAINITNLKAVFKGGADPRNNIMIFEVDIPHAVSLPVVQDALAQVSRRLDLDINVQHRKIFETMNRI